MQLGLLLRNHKALCTEALKELLQKALELETPSKTPYNKCPFMYN